jgi:hypothetical protein
LNYHPPKCNLYLLKFLSIILDTFRQEYKRGGTAPFIERKSNTKDKYALPVSGNSRGEKVPGMGYA